MKALLLTFLVVCVSAGYAQCPTAESIVKSKSKTKDSYGVNSQSRSGSVKSGETYEMSFIAQDGMDYRLSTKLANPAAGTISFEVYEMIVEKKMVDGKETYKRTKHVLANSNDSGTGSLEFTTDKSRKIFVAVSLSGGDPKKPVCVGVLVEDKKSTKLGF
ncbi:MAG TPA: hypothetical protein VK151_02950 [Fluviicola sp.]|nr:hypothetical protein [Fluviicola sp.]